MGQDPEKARLLVEREQLQKLLDAYMDLAAGECCDLNARNGHDLKLAHKGPQ